MNFIWKRYVTSTSLRVSDNNRGTFIETPKSTSESLSLRREILVFMHRFDYLSSTIRKFYATSRLHLLFLQYSRAFFFLLSLRLRVHRYDHVSYTWFTWNFMHFSTATNESKISDEWNKSNRKLESVIKSIFRKFIHEWKAWKVSPKRCF